MLGKAVVAWWPRVLPSLPLALSLACSQSQQQQHRQQQHFRLLCPLPLPPCFQSQQSSTPTKARIQFFALGCMFSDELRTAPPLLRFNKQRHQTVSLMYTNANVEKFSLFCLFGRWINQEKCLTVIQVYKTVVSGIFLRKICLHGTTRKPPLVCLSLSKKIWREIIFYLWCEFPNNASSTCRPLAFGQSQ